MLDIKLIREDPEPFRKALARRDLAERVDELLEADEGRRELTRRVEKLRAEQNRASKAIGGAEGDEKQRLIQEVAKVSAELKELEPQLAEAETALSLLLAATPNLPHPSSPDGFTEEDAVEVRRNHEAPPTFDFEPKDHADLGAALGVRPAPTGKTRAGCSASTSSTRWRCSHSRRRRPAGTSTSTSSASRRKCSASSRSRIASSTSPRATWAGPRRRSTTSRCGSP